MLASMVSGNLPAYGEGNRGTGRFGLIFAGRSNRAPLGDSYGCAAQGGVSAGIDFPVGDTGWLLGSGISTFLVGYHFCASADRVQQSLSFVEAQGDLRITSPPLAFGLRISTTVGASVSLTTVPLPPENQRRFFGSLFGVGLEGPIAGSFGWRTEIRSLQMQHQNDALSFALSLTSALP